jgi:hypothetical protein
MLFSEMLEEGIVWNTDEGGDGDAESVRHGCGAQTKFLFSSLEILRHEVEGVDVDAASQESFPKDDGKDDVDGRNKVVHCDEREENSIDKLEDGWELKEKDCFDGDQIDR